MKNLEKLQGIIRHILTFLGGFLVMKGSIDESTLLDVIGLITSLVGFVWSLINKDKLIIE